MAYGRDVKGSKIGGGCRALSGTSVASPVVAGAVTLLASTVPEARRGELLNPATMKQALVEGAERLPGLNLFEQGAVRAHMSKETFHHHRRLQISVCMHACYVGHIPSYLSQQCLQCGKRDGDDCNEQFVQGKLHLAKSKAVLDTAKPRVSVVPASLDLTDCPYMWPYCLQPLYAGAQPVIFNATVLNGLGVYGEFSRVPSWTPTDDGGNLLDVVITQSEALWPWTGHVSLFFRVKESGASFSGDAHGRVDFEVTSPPRRGEKV